MLSLERCLEVAGAPIALRDPNPNYDLWIAEAKADAFSLAHDEWLIRPYRSPHVGYWTGEIGLQWNSPENEGNRRIRDTALCRMVGGTVLDLGCGTPENVKRMQAFLEPYGPKYLGIDILAELEGRPHEAIDGLGVLAPLSAQAGDRLPGALVRGDMLEVLSQLPDGSMQSVALNGMDDPIVHHETRYGRAAAVEIERVVPPGGSVWGVTLTSGLLSSLVDSGSFHENFLPMPLRASNPRQAAILRYMGATHAGYYFLTKA